MNTLTFNPRAAAPESAAQERFWTWKRHSSALPATRSCWARLRPSCAHGAAAADSISSALTANDMKTASIRRIH